MWRYTVFFLLFLTACLNPEKGDYLNRGPAYSSIYPQTYSYIPPAYKVIGIKDGDTFVVLMNGKEQVVRLAHIDCPEKQQPFGGRAKKFISDQSFGKYVTLVHHGKYDRNHRLIAEVILKDGRNLNKELLKNGLAWHFKKYSEDKEYAALEVKARQQQVGLWKEPHPVAPWQWRRTSRVRGSAR